MGVIKNIIPAIASTNALVAAACCNETIKILTGCNYRLKNVSYSFGQTRMNIAQHEDQRVKDCLVCSVGEAKTFNLLSTSTLGEFVEFLKEKFTFNGPSIEHENVYLCCNGSLGLPVKFKLELTWE